MIIKTKKLGLAAYLKLKKCDLVCCEDGYFEFESKKSIDEWSVDYYNSCCSSHDAYVCNLRNMVRNR